MEICYIVGAGEFPPRDLAPREGDFVIAADGGLRALEGMSIRPDLLIGDLDSLGAYPLPEGVPLEKHPVENAPATRVSQLLHNTFATASCHS